MVLEGYMIKKLEAWLIRIFRAELEAHAAVVEGRAIEREARFIDAVENLMKDIASDVKNCVSGETADGIKKHIEGVAAKLHENVAADAKAIALYRHTVRLGCSACGQLTWEYSIDRTSGKAVCKDCQKKGA
jgi:formylmethanofuran dehydrogenase subunit E